MNLEEYERMSAYEATNWWWEGKRQLIIKELQRVGNHKPLMLDIGCGTGSNLKHWGNYGTVLGLDISSDALNFCKIKGNENLSRGDALRLPFRDNAFKIVFALDILEHIERDGDAVKEFFRVCCKNGYLLLTVPAMTLLWSKHDIALHHKRRYAKKQLESLLLSCGFHIEKTTFWNFSLLLPAAIYRLSGNIRPPGELRSDSLKVPRLVNSLFKYILFLESNLIFKGMHFPWGITLFTVCRKD